MQRETNTQSVFGAFSWPAAASLVSGLLSGGFIAFVWPYREADGARLFMAMIGAITLWAVSYGVALLVFDPTLRFLFEIPIWLGTCFTSLLFLAFALEYTGRKDAVRSPAMGALVALMIGFVALIGTNPRHHLVWQNYRIEPTFGAAGESTVSTSATVKVNPGTVRTYTRDDGTELTATYPGKGTDTNPYLLDFFGLARNAFQS